MRAGTTLPLTFAASIEEDGQSGRAFGVKSQCAPSRDKAVCHAPGMQTDTRDCRRNAEGAQASLVAVCGTSRRIKTRRKACLRGFQGMQSLVHRHFLVNTSRLPALTGAVIPFCNEKFVYPEAHLLMGRRRTLTPAQDPNLLRVLRIDRPTNDR